MPVRTYAESTFELEPELELHYQEYLRGHETEQALAAGILGDSSYVKRFHMPKHNGPVSMLREPKVAIRYAQKLGIPQSKSAHAQRAEYFQALRTTLHGVWSDLVRRCVEIFGNRGPLVSGIYRSHFPEPAKRRLRFLNQGYNLATDAWKLHHEITKSRSPYFTW